MHPRFLVRFVLLDLEFSVLCCVIGSHFVFLFFIFVLAVLRFSASDYSFGIFKLVFIENQQYNSIQFNILLASHLMHTSIE